MDANSNVRTVAEQQGALDETLAPCPFCGSKAKLTDAEPYAVECINDACLIDGPCHGSRAAAIAAWNRRAPPSQVAAANPAQVTDAIRGIVDDALNSAIPEPWEVAEHATQRILAAIGAGGQAVAPIAYGVFSKHGDLSGFGPTAADAEASIEGGLWEGDYTAPLYTHPSPSGKAVATDEIFDWLDTELSAIDCWYRGDPVHEHDAFWFKDKARDLVKDARKAFPRALSQPHPADERVVEALREALREHVEENVQNSYHIGIEREGKWMDGGCSEGEWLARELGLEPGWHDADAIKASLLGLVDRIIARAALGGSDHG